MYLSSLIAKTCVRKGKKCFREEGGWLNKTKLHLMYTTGPISSKWKHIRLFIHQMLVGELQPAGSTRP